MIKSDSIDKIMPALMKAQKEFPPVIKSATNPFFKSKYADLNTVINAVTPTLEANGLTIIQIVSSEDGNPGLETYIFHESLQYIGGSACIDTPKKDGQSVGSYLSYLRRYSILANLGLATEDDDCESTMDRKHKDAKEAEFSAANPDEPDAQMRRTFWALAKKKGLEGGELTEYFAGKAFASLTIKELGGIMTRISVLPDKSKATIKIAQAPKDTSIIEQQDLGIEEPF